ncbi:hypothetical protein LSA36186_08010 [Lachnoanaerobaculum sp. JCM 36186]|uniref:tetratricopeptide repeat protein n=1 Tax=Lachnoanaerobaculum sanguinis TaxID=3065809 RepID=UPI002777DBFF|nr:tetratricopeptide repeat protein [Lachnoanaerobaculum sp. JCM 36186]GMO02552.1 hypothetical protein LSA36186_08010 [Lachnoanaerobaculum sp. JCM 36186]
MRKLKLLLIFTVIILLLIGCKSKETRVQEQLDLGSKYMAELDYESAIVALNKAIEIDPKNVDTYKMLAEVYEKSGQLDDARTILEKALEIEDLPAEKIVKINEEIESLEYLVKISQIPKEYNETLSIELSNAKGIQIFYTIETEIAEMSIYDAEYKNSIVLDKNGTYIITTYTMDENRVKHDEAKVKYTIKLKSSDNDNSLSQDTSKDDKPEILKGWKQVGEDWYYYKDNGEPAKEWKKIDGKIYYFDDKGRMARNQIIKEKIAGFERGQVFYGILNSDQEMYRMVGYADINGEAGSISSMVSSGEVIDRGDYYEVTNVNFISYNTNDDRTELTEDIVYTGSVNIRKDAKAVVYSVGDYDGGEYKGGSTTYYNAEDYYNAAGGKLSMDTIQETLHIDMNDGVVYDSEGYIIGYGCLYYPNEKETANDGKQIFED